MTFFCTLAVSPFVNPALLGGLGLVAVPIIIHLLSRRRYRRVEWGAMRFLLEAEKKNRRRVRFEQWLLLFLRCAAMALLALLIARPFVRPGVLASVLGARGQVQRIIVLDDSASLRYRDGPESQFAGLRSAAVRLLTWLHQEAAGDPVSVYLTSKPAEPITAAARLGDEAVRELTARIEKLECSFATAQPRRAIEEIAAALAKDPLHSQADLYVFSDFQRADWIAPAESQSVFSPLRQREDLEVRAVLIGAGEAERSNLALTNLRFERPQTVAGVPAVVRALLANYSARPATEIQLDVLVDGSPVPVEPIDAIPAGESRSVAMEIVFPEAGSRELSVGINALDHFPADDARRAAVHATDTLKVLLVNGQPATDPAQDETFLLRNALSPQGQFASGIRVETTDPAELVSADLNAFDCVFLCNVGGLAELQMESLQNYVKAGGGLVIFVGDEITDPADYNRTMWADGRGVLPLPLVRIVTPAARAEGVGIVRVGEHAITSMFPADADALSEYVHFRAFFECDLTSLALDHSSEPGPDAGSANAGIASPKPTDGSTAVSNSAADAPQTASSPVVLARYSDANQSPAVIEKKLGAGAVLLFTSTADLAWNDWGRSIDGSYVVTMLETVQHIARKAAEPGEFIAGEQLSVRIAPDVSELSASFRPPRFPDDPAVDVAYRQPGALPTAPVRLDGPVAAELGSYRVEIPRRAGGVESRLLCVNLAPTESNLAIANQTEIGTALGRIPYQYVPLAQDFLRSGQQSRHELWPFVLTCLVLVLMFEQALAWWFGGGLARRGREDSRWQRYSRLWRRYGSARAEDATGKTAPTRERRDSRTVGAGKP